MESKTAAPTPGLLGLVLSVSVCVGLGALSGLASSAGPGEWYNGLAKSALTPPPLVFIIIWPTFYSLMGVSLWLLLREPRSEDRQRALRLFGVQFIINFTWSWVFFNQHWIAASVIHIAFLWLAVATFITSARKVAPWAAYINLPYLLWTTFALYLSYQVWRLNS